MDYGAQAQMTRHDSWTKFLESQRSRGGRLVLFTTQGASPFHQFEFRKDDALLFGRESAGVPPEVHDAADARLIIPLVAGARSLNLTVSAAIAVSEALRQTGGFPAPAPDAP